METWEFLSYVVTVIGLPFAIVVFLMEQRKERENEEEEVFQSLSDNYQEFLKTVLDNADLHLFSRELRPDLTAEDKERMLIIFDMLISLFERAYLLLYDERMTDKQRRRWQSWEDYMREWLRRPEFRSNLDQLLSGEDPEFTEHLRKLASDVIRNP
jgi:hypothetical protein